MCGLFHMAAPSTTFTFWPPDRPCISECVLNSGSSPKSSRCFAMIAWVSGRAYRPSRAASLASISCTILPKPIASSCDRGSHMFLSGGWPTHCTSYS